MYSIIQKICEKNNKILKEGLEKVLKGDDISSLTSAIADFTNEMGKDLFTEIVKQIDELVYEDSKRKTQYESVRYGKRKYITQNGKTKFERRYYEDKETGEHIYLTDKILGIDKGERIDKKVKSEVIRKANDQSYSKSGKGIVPGVEISGTTVMRNVRKNDWKMEIENRKEEEKVVQIRRELVNKFTFSGLYKDNQELWEDVSYYIDCTYNKETIENIFIMGDGASYIKEGLNWISNSVFVLDLFHLEKYINHLNYDEELKKKLQLAIDQYDPVSTENIMNEAISRIEQEIIEDKQLGRNTKRLENRLKKVKDTKKYFINQWEGIEAHDNYKDKLTGCCQEGQVHHTLSERMSTDAKVWSENGIDEMSQLRAFTQNGGDIYAKIIDISTEEKREKKIEELEKRIKRKAKKTIFGTVGAKLPTLTEARGELYYELKKIWYGIAM